ncbi:hypothetical protein LCGC14_0375770 [marine sediment metagenome]|uniref:Uncharacterized protein n=1 Tax=marine sediment metagenome TaxID=412755 RepID=A0A0F9T9L7_9ZZZZ
MYKKNYAPKSRQEVAGANDHLWISEQVKYPANKARYDKNYEKIFKHK